ncbi:hypothetical protein [Natronoflexus pectinivorans]|uniref:Uncharacterized protein n=1 Tax=Natronoflexus pectinivorans TaxID=682526 RepID=A0A4V2RWW0_9BACT|nr:hypothetical protein [Natronoflexus pectinivorans]TCO10431.1 hypothetical protein EV194_10161 [Natronoflexus pectinivorans]
MYKTFFSALLVLFFIPVTGQGKIVTNGQREMKVKIVEQTPSRVTYKWLNVDERPQKQP